MEHPDSVGPRARLFAIIAALLALSFPQTYAQSTENQGAESCTFEFLADSISSRPNLPPGSVFVIPGGTLIVGEYVDELGNTHIGGGLTLDTIRQVVDLNLSVMHVVLTEPLESLVLEYSGRANQVNLWANGEVQVAESFAATHGSTIGGALISGDVAVQPRVLRLEGELSSFGFGSSELQIHRICLKRLDRGQ